MKNNCYIQLTHNHISDNTTPQVSNITHVWPTSAGVPCERGVLSVSEIWVVWPACHDCPTIDKREPCSQYGKGLQEVNKIIMRSLAHWYRCTYTPFVKLFGLENLWIPPPKNKKIMSIWVIKYSVNKDSLGALRVADCLLWLQNPLPTHTPPTVEHCSIAAVFVWLAKTNFLYLFNTGGGEVCVWVCVHDRGQAHIPLAANSPPSTHKYTSTCLLGLRLY